MAVRIKDKYTGPILQFRAGSGGVAADQFVITASGEVVDTPTGTLTAATAVGLALKAGVEDAVIPVVPLSGVVFAIDIYQGGATDSATDAMLGARYDIDVEAVTLVQRLNLNDTTNPWLTLVGYDNTRKEAYVVFDAASLLYSV
jgi:hypothetical protein